MSNGGNKSIRPLSSKLRGGSNQARVRDHNERLVLSLIRRSNNLSRAEIARLTGLSAQTVTVIMRALEEDFLLLRGQPVKGKVGQPSIPMRLNPEGAFSIGLKVGRRSADLVLMDFGGNIKRRLHIAYSFPVTLDIVDFAKKGAKKFMNILPENKRRRMAGIGIAIPFELWNWGAQVGAPAHEMDAWREFDLSGAIHEATKLPVYLQNDATAGCGAELVLGRGREFENYCYLYIGFFIGGGIVLNNTVFSGPTGNAGAFGALPVSGSGAGYEPLIDRASVFSLEKMLLENGTNPSFLWLRPDMWGEMGTILDTWIAQVAQSLAIAIVATCSVIDFGAVIIDGGCPDTVRARIVNATSKELERMNATGIRPVQVYPGSIGPSAPAMGGAILPIVSRYFINQTAIYH